MFNADFGRLFCSIGIDFKVLKDLAGLKKFFPVTESNRGLEDEVRKS